MSDSTSGVNVITVVEQLNSLDPKGEATRKD